MKKKRRIYIVGVFVLVLVAWIYLWFFRGNKKAQGIYITCAGQSYLEIKSGLWGFLKIKEGLLFHTPFHYPLKQRTIKSHFKWGRIILIQKDIYSVRNIGEFDEYQVFFTLECQASKTVLGDWDLVRGEIETVLHNSEPHFSEKRWQKIWDSGSIPEFWRNLTRSVPDVTYFHFVYESSNPPLSSFLHKVDDRVLAEYYKMRIKGNSSERALQLAEKLTANHPDDPFLSLHLVEMEALRGDSGKSIDLWEEWRRSYEKSAPPLLLHIAKKTSQTIAMVQWKNTHPDEISPLQVWDSGETNLQDSLECYKSWIRSDETFTSDTIIVPHSRFIFVEIDKPENRSFAASPIIRTMAYLYLFQGRQRESLELFASLYRMGQSLSSFGGLLQRRNDFFLLNIVSKDLLFHVLNACTKKEDLIFCRDILDRLYRFDMEKDMKSIFDDEFTPLVFFMKPGSNMNPLIYNQFSEPRQNKTRMYLQLIRAACAARYHFITTGNFPTSEKDFAPFLKEGIPRDLFTEKDAIQFFASPDGRFVLYSVGPDGDNDKASVIYDPLNRETENGDIVINIPREREFPFPKDKVHAANANELLEQFPNGLPPDGFSFSLNSPLSILESTDTHPLVIFSFGPDRDESEYKPPVRSDTEKNEPVFHPEPGSKIPIKPGFQKVMKRGETIPPALGYWTLEPMYDPTNGANSNGDLFIEIPH